MKGWIEIRERNNKEKIDIAFYNSYIKLQIFNLVSIVTILTDADVGFMVYLVILGFLVERPSN